MIGVETWRPIPGANGYEASDQGRVRSVPRVDRRGGRQRGHVITGSVNGDGYRIVRIIRHGEQQYRGAHVLVMEAFVGPCPVGLQTRHLDGDSLNNRLSNLVYGTPGENNADTVAHGHHRNAAKTHCLRDHQFTEANTQWQGGKRRCRECQVLRQPEQTRRRRERERARKEAA